jgi:hypothetical protein
MADQIGDLLTQRDVDEYAKQDDLLARIENDRLVDAWCWPPMTETVGRLRSLPPGCAWLATRYLQTIVLRGNAVFGDPAHYQTALFAEEAAPVVRCRCGDDVRADPPRTVNRREVLIAVCPRCGIATVMYDREPYPDRTLISAMMT